MINKVILVGRLGKDSILRQTQTGKNVLSFSIATSESYKDDKGEWQNKSEWHNIVFWINNGNADHYAQKLKKGELCYIEGKITSRSYEQEGVKKYTTEIVAGIVRHIATGTNANSDAGARQSNATIPDEPLVSQEIPDDLPF